MCANNTTTLQVLLTNTVNTVGSTRQAELINNGDIFRGGGGGQFSSGREGGGGNFHLGGRGGAIFIWEGGGGGNFHLGGRGGGGGVVITGTLKW